MNRAIEFFSDQFDRQIAAGDYQLNPFEQLAAPYLRGRVLDLGCGLGNFALAAARRGHEVTALDACPRAVADLARRARAEGLVVHAEQSDLSNWTAVSEFDTVVAIGLLMFFTRVQANAVLSEVQKAAAPGGIVVLNVLVEGTTFMDMFDPVSYCLFRPDEVTARFATWRILEHQIQDFPAGDRKLKRFTTLIAERPPLSS